MYIKTDHCNIITTLL